MQLRGGRPVLVLLLPLACRPVLQDDHDACDSSGLADDSAASNADGAESPPDDDDGPSTASAGDSDSDGPSTATDGDPTGAAPPVDGTVIASGEHFIDAFFTEAGLILVHAAGADLVARDGELLRSYASPRTITAADWEDDLLVLADQAMFTTLDPALETVGTGSLTEGCMGVALISGARFVCGPENDWDRILYTYDAIEGTSLATSPPYTYNGTPMRGVPGLDEFITITHNLSPSDFHLYVVDEATHVTTYVNESPYHGDFYVGIGYAFFGSPATHVITEQGLLLQIRGDGCTNTSPYGADCFVKDGELGTLPPGVGQYLDLRESGDATVYGLLSTGTGYPEPLCTTCTLQRIDVTQRLVVGEAAITAPGEIHLLRPDPAGDGVVLISTNEAPFRTSFSATDPGYQVFYFGL